MPNPSVSVIVPTYNRPGFLARALASIRSQTYKDYEIIVINDGGDDHARQVCWLFDPVIYKQHGENFGLAAARNSGINLANGKYIVYLDDDDLWLPQHLEKLVKFRSQTDCQLVYSDSYFWTDEQKFELLLSERYTRDAIRQRNLTPICSVLHDKVLFDMAGRFNEDLSALEDWDMWLRMSEHTDFQHLPEVTALYSKRNGSDQMSMDLAMMAETFQQVKKGYEQKVRA